MWFTAGDTTDAGVSGVVVTLSWKNFISNEWRMVDGRLTGVELSGE